MVCNVNGNGKVGWEKVCNVNGKTERRVMVELWL